MNESLTLQGFFGRLNLRQMLAPLLIILILSMMVLPLPTFVLDVFFTFNIAISIMVLLVAMYVLKPLDFIAGGKKGLVQPAIKCRGREYLRIIYGPDYTDEANLTRLRLRGLGAKRSLALREFALGVEGLERFVRREPLRRVHECVFGVLALESEPVDPRL